MHACNAHRLDGIEYTIAAYEERAILALEVGDAAVGETQMRIATRADGSLANGRGVRVWCSNAVDVEKHTAAEKKAALWNKLLIVGARSRTVCWTRFLIRRKSKLIRRSHAAFLFVVDVRPRRALRVQTANLVRHVRTAFVDCRPRFEGVETEVCDFDAHGHFQNSRLTVTWNI